MKPAVPKIATLVVAFIVLAVGVVAGLARFSPPSPFPSATTIHFTVDGVPSTVQLYANTVGEVLSEEEVSTDDAVISPDLATPVEDDARITVRYNRPLEVVVDGEAKSFTVDEPVLADALSQTLPDVPSNSYTSVPLDTELPRVGLASPVIISTPKAVLLTSGGIEKQVFTTAPTVGEVLAEQGLTPDKDDAVSVQLDSPTMPNMRVRYVERSLVMNTASVSTPFSSTKQEDAELPEGTTRVIQKGKDLVETHTVRSLFINGKLRWARNVKTVVTQEAQDEIIAVGTALAYPEVDPGSARAMAQEQMRAYGWGADEFSCLDALWMRESGWNYKADNPNSSAYGIPQALPGSKMASAGEDWLTNPATQIKWGLSYVAERYGSPCNAKNYSDSHGYY